MLLLPVEEEARDWRRCRHRSGSLAALPPQERLQFAQERRGRGEAEEEDARSRDENSTKLRVILRSWLQNSHATRTQKQQQGGGDT